MLGAEEMMVGTAAEKRDGIVRRLLTCREIELISTYIEGNGSQVSHGCRGIYKNGNREG